MRILHVLSVYGHCASAVPFFPCRGCELHAPSRTAWEASDVTYSAWNSLAIIGKDASRASFVTFSAHAVLRYAVTASRLWGMP